MSVTAVPLQPIRKGSVLRVWLGVAVVAAGSALLTWNGLRPFGHGESHDKGGQSSRIVYQILDPGTGERPAKDDIAWVSYRGMRTDGKMFDQSPQPLPIDLSGRIPQGTMIPGFTEAVMLLKKGGRIRVEVPPALGYGDEAKGDVIPANSTLVFEIVLDDFKTMQEAMEAQRNAQMQQQLQQQMQQGGGAPQGGPQGAPSEAPSGAPVLQP